MTTVDPVTIQDFQPKQQQDAAATFTNDQKRDELAREVNMRKALYPSLIRQGKISQQQADRQLAIISEIWTEYAQKASDDQKQREPELPLGSPTESTPP